MRFVVCGEALIDLIPDNNNSSSSQTHWLAACGGGPMNTAIALGRLNQDVWFLGRFGHDAFADQLRNHLMASKVKLDFSISTDQATSLAIVNLAADGQANYTFHFHETANFNWQTCDFPALSSSDWLHFGSIGAVIRPGADALFTYLKTTNAKLSYDINVRTAVLPDLVTYRHHVAQIMRLVGQTAGIVKASDEDIRLLVEDLCADPIMIAKQWLDKYHLGLFVLTLGAQGAVAIKPDGQQFRVSGLPVNLVDAIGAGDGFMAGFLTAYVNNSTEISAALQFGTEVAAMICERTGANPPTVSELESFRLSQLAHQM